MDRQHRIRPVTAVSLAVLCVAAVVVAEPTWVTVTIPPADPGLHLPLGGE